eukprot:gene19-140_t
MQMAMTQQKQMEMQLDYQQKMLQRADKKQVLTFISSGVVHTVLSAASVRFFAIVRAFLGAAGDEELQKFNSYNRCGSQGVLSIEQFAAELDRLYQAVGYLGTVHPDSHIHFFIKGLNDGSLRQHLLRVQESNYGITMEELLHKARQFTEHTKQGMIMDSISKAWGTDSSKSGPVKLACYAMTESLLERKRAQDPIIKKMPPKQQDLINAAFELLLVKTQVEFSELSQNLQAEAEEAERLQQHDEDLDPAAFLAPQQPEGFSLSDILSSSDQDPTALAVTRAKATNLQQKREPKPKSFLPAAAPMPTE